MDTSENSNLTILGSGSWGATLGVLLSEEGHRVTLWAHQEEIIAELKTKGHPPGVPELALPDSISLTSDLGKACAGKEAVIIAVPSQVVAPLCQQLAAFSSPPTLVILVSKGIDIERVRPLSDVVTEFLPNCQVGVLSGPCIAREVAKRVPTSVVAACKDSAVSERIQGWFHNKRFRVYRQNDVLGVELGGAMKNIIAIGAGVSDGLGFGDNSKSAVMTRGLAEMTRAAVALGAEAKTISGLAGLGDLAVTCFSPYSRNRRFGEMIGKGISPKEAIESIGEVVEGIPTARALVQLARQHNFPVPIAEVVVQLSEGTLAPLEALESLMSREPKAEF